ncbi:hypothetical protein, partial [Staphylococcus epidermidis]|uniref:hypothetical protein n=1 Tax=Staphylococcus epidermidis TaxID=1282 RepID=UPI00119FFA19
MKSGSVEEVGEEIEEVENDVYEVIGKGNEWYEYDLSGCEKSMYVLWKVNGKERVYKIGFLWRLCCEVNVMELEGGLCKLIEGDEILGTEYVIDE